MLPERDQFHLLPNIKDMEAEARHYVSMYTFSPSAPPPELHTTPPEFLQAKSPGQHKLSVSHGVSHLYNSVSLMQRSNGAVLIVYGVACAFALLMASFRFWWRRHLKKDKAAGVSKTLETSASCGAINHCDQQSLRRTANELKKSVFSQSNGLGMSATPHLDSVLTDTSPAMFRTEDAADEEYDQGMTSASSRTLQSPAGQRYGGDLSSGTSNYSSARGTERTRK